jgi:hypothetical protein
MKTIRDKASTKANRIRAYLSANPKATTKEVASACDAKLSNVYQVRYAMKKETQPPRTYRKKVLEKREFKFIPQDKPLDLVNNVLVVENEQLKIEVRSLEHQIVGYRAVIDFLEWQLNLRRTNHGASV